MNFKQNSPHRSLRYNILLAGFALSLVALSIEIGPPPLASPPQVETTPPDQAYQILGATPTDIRWYEIRESATERSAVWQRDESGNWSDETGQAIETRLGEGGTQILADYRVRPITQFGPTDDLSQYGLTSPQYVVSFGINAYNNSIGIAQDTFTLYVGSLTSDQQAYYTVFVNEASPGGPMWQGEWVYAIPTGYINILVDVMLNQILSEGTPSAATPSAEPSP